MHVESEEGWEERETGMPGVHFSPNEKQVTVHCKAIWLVGTVEPKKREEEEVEFHPPSSFWYLTVNCCPLHLFCSGLLTIKGFIGTSFFNC